MTEGKSNICPRFATLLSAISARKSFRTCPKRIENRNRKNENRNYLVFETILDEVSKQKSACENRNPREKQPRPQPSGRSQLAHTCSILLRSATPIHHRGKQTRSRKVAGPAKEVAARPTLTPRDQTSNYTENELPISISRASSSTFLKICSLWLERRETKAKERRRWCCGSPAGCLRGGAVRLGCRATYGLDAVYGGPDVIF